MVLDSLDPNSALFELDGGQDLFSMLQSGGLADSIHIDEAPVRGDPLIGGFSGFNTPGHNFNALGSSIGDNAQWLRPHSK